MILNKKLKNKIVNLLKQNKFVKKETDKLEYIDNNIIITIELVKMFDLDIWINKKDNKYNQLLGIIHTRNPFLFIRTLLYYSELEYQSEIINTNIILKELDNG